MDSYQPWKGYFEAYCSIAKAVHNVKFTQVRLEMAFQSFDLKARTTWLCVAERRKRSQGLSSLKQTCCL